MDSNRSSDAASSIAEFLEKEKLCQDTHKQTQVVCTNSQIDCTTPVHDFKNCSSDEEIGSLLCQMKELLSPHDLDYLDANEGRSVEDLLKEARELIRTSPLSKHIDGESNLTKSVDVSMDNSSKQGENGLELLKHSKDFGCDNRKIDKLMREMEDLANCTSTILGNSTSKSTGDIQNEIVSCLSSSSSSPLTPIPTNLKTVSSFCDLNIPSVNDKKETVISCETNQRSERNQENFDIASLKSDSSDKPDSPIGSINDHNYKPRSPFKSRNCRSGPEDIREDSEPKKNVQSKKLLKIDNESLSLSDLEVPEKNIMDSCSTSSPLKAMRCSSRNLEENGANDLESKVDLDGTENIHVINAEKLQQAYGEEIKRLNLTIEVLQLKLAKYEAGNISHCVAGEVSASKDSDEMDRLKAEVDTQERLIAGYQKENQKLFQEITAAKVQWKKERDHLEAVVRSMSSRKMGNNQGLEEQLKDARETIVRYRMELDRYKAENEGLEEECQQLRETIALLESETTDQRRKIDILTSQQSSQTALAHTTADIALTQQLAKAQELLSNKEYQLEELNNELKGMRLASGSTKKENGLIEEINSLKMTVSQLQAALSLERTQNKTLAKDRTVLTRENSDLKRQVKEVEGIIKQRNKSDSNVASIVGGENRLKELEELLSSRQAALVVMQQQLQEMEEKYEKHLIELERDLSAVREENRRLKERKNELASKESSGNGQSAATSKKSCSSSSRCAPTSSNCSAAAAREDAHLLATIRGLKLELSSKEKEVMKLSRDLEDAKKTNKRLQREREKQLKTASPIKPTSEMSLKSDKSMNANVGLTDSSLGRGYNPNLYQEEIEAAALIKMENKSLREEIRRLGKDILTLNNKRLQDLLSLQTEHEQEIQRLINDYTNRHSQTAVAELQGQIYTQQMVINHLKEQLKQLTLLQEENAMLKLERDHLEKALMGANKKVQELATPEACQYRNLLDKFENLERRHEVREQKLQSIVRDLLASNSDPVPCGTVCRNKLLDKNREICYYRVEMDKILEALREFKRSK